jgi:hypothetical protein
MEIYKIIIGLIFVTTLPFMFMPALIAIFNDNENLGYIVMANGLILIFIYFGIFYTIQNASLLLVIPEIIVILILWLLCFKYVINEKP